MDPLEEPSTNKDNIPRHYNDKAQRYQNKIEEHSIAIQEAHRKLLSNQHLLLVFNNLKKSQETQKKAKSQNSWP